MGKPDSLDSGPPALTERGARDLLNHVIEYLQYLQYHQTVQTLLTERSSKRSQLNNSLLSARTQSKDARERLRAEMLRKFDEGRRDDFFTLWQQYVPASMLGLDFATQKFEFYLQVYFSIYAVLPSSCVLVVTPGQGSRLSAHASSSRHELAQRMRAFKSYLEGRGAGLAHTAEFLPYYALPYVPQPEHHPSFETLFQSRWVDQQRLQLKNFLESLASRSASQVPLLYVMYNEHLQATDGVPRLSPRGRALRASTRAHPHSREASRGSVGRGSLSSHPPGFIRSSSMGAGPNPGHLHQGGGGGGGGGILQQHEALVAAGGAGAGRRLKPAPLPPPRNSFRPVSGTPSQTLSGMTSVVVSESGAPEGAAVTAAVGARKSLRRGGGEDAGDGAYSDDGFVQDDDDEDGGIEEGEEQARAAAAVLRRNGGGGAGGDGFDEDEDEGDQEDEQEMAEALRSPTSGDLPPAGAFSSAAAGPKASVALSLEQLGMAEGGVLRDSVQLLESTMGTLDAVMAEELAAAGAAAAGASGDGSQTSRTGLAPLDYAKVKRDLQGPDTLLAARLLQALRWRLTRSRPGADRWGLIASWIEVDLLDCHTPAAQPPAKRLRPGAPSAAPSTFGPSSPSAASDAGGGAGGAGGSEPCSLLQLLAASHDPRVVEEVTRLSNAIASDRLGRNYLMMPGGEAVTSLLGVLRRTASLLPPPPQAAEGGEQARGAWAGSEEEEGGGGGGSHPRDGPVAQQALVALQKLSLKRRAQSQMIREGAVAWVTEFLQDLPTASPTAVEYGTALLMNLCLRSAGRAAAAASAEPLLQLCENLLNYCNDQVRTYINGTLYSIFSRAAVREAATARGTAQQLEAVATSGQPPFAPQAQYILRQLYMPDLTEQELDVSDDEAAPDGDVDAEVEEGVDEPYADVDITPETLERVPGEACGEELLCGGGYLATSQEAREHISAVRSSVAAAAAGKTTLRGSVLLDTLPRGLGATMGSVLGGLMPQGDALTLEEGEEGAEDDDDDGVAGGGGGENDGDGGGDEEQGGEPDVAAAGAADGDDLPSPAAATAAAATAAAATEPRAGPPAPLQGIDTTDPTDADPDCNPDGGGGGAPGVVEDTCPSPLPGRGSLHHAVSGGLPGGRSSSRPPSTYVTLATSTASTSIVQAARALEAARVSGGSGAAGLSTVRRRSCIKPVTPSSLARTQQPWDARDSTTEAESTTEPEAEAGLGAGAGPGPGLWAELGSRASGAQPGQGQEPEASVLQASLEGRARASAAYSEAGGVSAAAGAGSPPPRPPSQGGPVGQPRPPPPLPPPSHAASQEGVPGGSGLVLARPPSRPQSPYPSVRGSGRRVSESGSQSLAAAAAAAAAARVGGAAERSSTASLAAASAAEDGAPPPGVGRLRRSASVSGGGGVAGSGGEEAEEGEHQQQQDTEGRGSERRSMAPGEGSLAVLARGPLPELPGSAASSRPSTAPSTAAASRPASALSLSAAAAAAAAAGIARAGPPSPITTGAQQWAGGDADADGDAAEDFIGGGAASSSPPAGPSHPHSPPPQQPKPAETQPAAAARSRAGVSKHPPPTLGSGPAAPAAAAGAGRAGRRAGAAAGAAAGRRGGGGPQAGAPPGITRQASGSSHSGPGRAAAAAPRAIPRPPSGAADGGGALAEGLVGVGASSLAAAAAAPPPPHAPAAAVAAARGEAARHPTPPSRSTQRTRMGPAPASVSPPAATATAAGVNGGGVLGSPGVFATKRQLPRTPP